MLCPACHYQDSKVLDSRTTRNGVSVRRRRMCPKCHFRFSTQEEVEILDLTVIKRNGQREPYVRNKLHEGLRRALYKRQVGSDDLAQLVSRIERDVQVKYHQEVKSSDLGEIVMRHLKKFDKIAYIRFASVYRKFEDLETFHKELAALLPKRKMPARKIRKKRK